MGLSFKKFSSAINKLVPRNIKGPAKDVGRSASLAATAGGRDKLIKDITANEQIDTISKNEFLDILMGVGTVTSGNRGRVGYVANEFAKAMEGIDPKYRSRKNVEEYYKLVVDRPGNRQTRSGSMDLLASNAFAGMRG